MCKHSPGRWRQCSIHHLVPAIQDPANNNDNTSISFDGCHIESVIIDTIRNVYLTSYRRRRWDGGSHYYFVLRCVRVCVCERCKRVSWIRLDTALVWKVFCRHPSQSVPKSFTTMALLRHCDFWLDTQHLASNFGCDVSVALWGY